MINGDVIAKNEMTVKDDVFNSIVNGIKTPIEKDVDIQKAEVSNVYLKGKQLQRFKQKIIPEFTKSFQNEGLIHDYVQASREEYEKLKVEEVKAAYEASVQEIKAVNEDIDDELEEIESDKKGFIYFLKKGWTIFKWVSRLIRLYSFYKMALSTFDKSKAYVETKKPKKFNWDDYDISKELDRENLLKDLTNVSKQWTSYYSEKFFGPFLTHLTAIIFAFSDMAYRKINRGLFLFTLKQIGIALAKEVVYYGWLHLILWATGVGGKASIARIGKVVTNVVKQTTDILKRGAKVASRALKLTRAAKKARSAFFAAKVLKDVQRIRKTKNAFDKAAKNKWASDMAERTVTWARRFDIAYQTGQAVYRIVDAVNIEQDDVDELKEKVKGVSVPLGNRLIGLINISEGVIKDDLKTTFNKLSTTLKDSVKRFTNDIMEKFVTKYKTTFEIELFRNKDYNFEMLMESIGEVVDFFKIIYELPKTNYFPFTKTDYGWRVNMNGIAYEIQKDIIKFNDGSKLTFGQYYKTDNDDTNDYSLTKSNFYTLRKRIRVRPENGIRLRYDKNGTMFAADVFVEIDTNKSEKEGWSSNGISNDRIKINYKNNAQNFVSVFFVQNYNNNFFSIEKKTNDFLIKTKKRFATEDGQGRIEHNDIKGIKKDYYEMDDLSEITNSRNIQLEGERDFEQNAEKLKELVKEIFKS